MNQITPSPMEATRVDPADRALAALVKAGFAFTIVCSGPGLACPVVEPAAAA